MKNLYKRLVDMLPHIVDVQSIIKCGRVGEHILMNWKPYNF